MLPSIEPAPAEAADKDDPLTEVIHAKLSKSLQPLSLADIAKGLPKPKKVKTPEFQASLLSILDEEFQLGRVFRYPSGKNDSERFWTRDEKQALRDAAIKQAAKPIALSAMKTALGKVLKGTSPGFVEEVVRGLIGEDRLFEHPAKTAKGGPLFATEPPPPPVPTLETPKFKKKFETLAKSVEKLAGDAAVEIEEVIAAIRKRFSTTTLEEDFEVSMPASPPVSSSIPRPELEGLILAGLEHAGPGGIMSLADLRIEMPEECRGREFDEEVLRLAEEKRVQIYQDVNPDRFLSKGSTEYVTDGLGHLFTTIGLGA